MNKTIMMSLSAAALMLAVQSTYAADTPQMGNMQKDMGAGSTKMHKGHGIVNKINARSGKVNISHEPIESMNWPKMTMDFSVQNMADLEAIKPGMPVDFELTQKGTGYMISNIKPAK